MFSKKYDNQLTYVEVMIYQIHLITVTVIKLLICVYEKVGHFYFGTQCIYAGEQQYSELCNCRLVCDS